MVKRIGVWALIGAYGLLAWLVAVGLFTVMWAALGGRW